MWRDRRVFVTGCNGFLGSWVTSRLVDAGAQVVGLIRDVMPGSLLTQSGMQQRIIVVSGELEDYPLLERTFTEFEIDSCFHLAAQAIVGMGVRLPMATFESNIRGTWNLLEAARRVGKVQRLVVTSSDKVYGTKPQLPYVETDPLLGEHPYDVSKVCTDLLAQTYARQYGLPIAVARCGNLYGQGDLHISRIIPATIRSLVRDERPVIRSDGTYLRDYFYVEDAAEALLKLGAALDDPTFHGEAFNFGTETPTPVLEVVEHLIRFSGRRHLAPNILNQAADEIREQWLSCAKAKARLGWEPATSLAAGLAKTWPWYEQFFAGQHGLEDLHVIE